MALDEQSWHEARDALAKVVGAEAAARLMGAWPRDVARRSGTDSIDAKIKLLDAKVDAPQATIGAFVIGFVRFAA